MKNQIKNTFLQTLLILFISLTANNLHAQNKCADWNWAKKITGGNIHKKPIGQNIITDSSGNVYIIGSFIGTLSFDSIILKSTGLEDAFIAKMNKEGKYLWVRHLESVFIYDNIALDAGENIYITGGIGGKVNFGNNIILDTFGYFVAKMNSNGQCQWATKYKLEKGSYSTIEAIAADKYGNIYLTGSFDWKISFNNTILTANGNQDVFIAKINNNGQWQWAQRAGQVNFNEGKGITIDAKGDIYVTGNFSDSINFGNISLNGSGGFIVKYNSNGLEKWARKFDGGGENIILDDSGNIFITALFKGLLNLGNIQLTSYGYFAAKMDSSGIWHWAVSPKIIHNYYYQNYYGESSPYFKINKKGDLYVSGVYNNIAQFGNIYLDSIGNNDIYIAKLEKNGQWQWAISAGGKNHDVSGGFDFDKSGNIYLLGNFMDTVSFGNKILTATANQSEIFIAKLNNNEPKISGDSLVCPTSVKPYKATTNTTATHNWSVTGGTIQSGQGTDGISVLWNGVGLGRVKLVSISTSGCKDSATLFINIDSSNCKWVWPGDADYNKIVNSDDLLKIGLAYNETGAARKNASSAWKAQLADDWSKSFNSGVNYKHADCNGDGIIDSTDITVINNNYGQSWKKRSGSAQQAGPNDAGLILQFAKDSFQAGETVNIAVKLGTSVIPAKDVYGLAFSFTLDPALVENNSVKLNLSGSWLDATGKSLISLTKDFTANGYADIAISRTNKQNATGSGTIGNISFVLKKDLGGQSATTKVLPVEIREILAISANEDTIPLNTFGDSAIAYQKTSGINEQTLAEESISIYPNPTTGIFILDLKGLSAQKIQVINTLGQQVWSRTNILGKQEIQLQNVSAGLYFINIQTQNGVIARQLIINK